MKSSLPIWDHHQQIISILQTDRRLVIVAPTGSGKTTQVPQMLLDAGLAGPRRIVVLQPRRVAARTVAARVASERNKPLGSEVGYQIRFDDQTSSGTRISFVTEGILLRHLQTDPALSDVGILVFDEFHERNVLSDVALALAKHRQAADRPDLKIVVMSATLDAEPVAFYLADPAGIPCPIITSEGRVYPVENHHLDHPDQRPSTEQAADAVERILHSNAPGDILIFMPGMGEIQSTISALRALRKNEPLELIPLHGDLPPEDQDRAFASSPSRKVIVATNVAETSITIDGIRHVVDSGLARIARYDADRGINTLFIEEISQASADQRAGRAGRTAPGTCHRLWTASGHLNRPSRNTPEIQRSDLAEIVLLLHSLHIHAAAEFDWLDKPDPAAVQRAEHLLSMLGALDPSGELTQIGHQMLRLPMHPRYSRMLVEASRYGRLREAALCAALVSGRDLLVRLRRDDQHIAEARELFEASQDSDFYTLILAFRFAQQNQFNTDRCRRYGIHAQTARQIEQTFQQILGIAENQLPQGPAREAPPTTPSPSPGPVPAPSSSEAGSDPLLRCLMTGFIDQLCVRRDRGTLECDMVEGRHGTLMRESVVQNAPVFVAASVREVSGRTSENLVLLGLATAVRIEWIEESFPQQITSKVEHLFDRGHRRVAAVRLLRFHDLILKHEHLREPDPLAAGRCLAHAFHQGWFELPLFNHEIRQFIARVNLVSTAVPELEIPPLDSAAVAERLAHAFQGLTLAKEAQAVPLKDHFLGHLQPAQKDWINELAPTAIRWPDGRQLKIQYPETLRDENEKLNPPELQIKLQDCFQLREHPRICDGKIPVKLWLAAPDGKRLESTIDWPAFKAAAYPKLRSILQKKYPGVPWL